MNRVKLSEEAINRVFNNLKLKFVANLHEKGEHCLISRHEIYGVVAEEFNELTMCLHGQFRCDGPIRRFKEELIDIAVAAALGAASIEMKGLDW